MTQQLTKKKNRYEKIQKELPFYMNAMLLLGLDANKHEYWVRKRNYFKFILYFFILTIFFLLMTKLNYIFFY